jgi:hypothetical protein
VEASDELPVHEDAIALGDAVPRVRSDRGVPRRDREKEEALARLRNGEPQLGQPISSRCHERRTVGPLGVVGSISRDRSESLDVGEQPSIALEELEEDRKRQQEAGRYQEDSDRVHDLVRRVLPSVQQMQDGPRNEPDRDGDDGLPG